MVCSKPTVFRSPEAEMPLGSIRKPSKAARAEKQEAAPSASLLLPPPYLYTSTIISAYQLLQVQGNDASVAWISPERKKKKKSHSFRWAMAELTLKHEQAQYNEMVQ